MLYIHIGLPKSGSSAIQVYLNDRADELMSYGVLYPWKHGYPQQYRTSGGNGRKLIRVAKQVGEGDSISSLKKEIREFSQDTVIISSESISVYFDDPHELKKLLPEDVEIKVIVYLRNQVDKFISDVNQTIKNAYRKNYRINENWFVFNDYYRQIKKWESVFGEESVIVRGYDKESFPDGDVVADFCRLLNIPYLGYDKKSPVNPSLQLPYLEVMRSFNSMQDFSLDESKKTKEVLKRYLWEASVESGEGKENKEGQKNCFIKKEDLLSIVDRLSESNAQVENEYGVSGLNLASAAERYNSIRPFLDREAVVDVLSRMAKNKSGF